MLLQWARFQYLERFQVHPNGKSRLRGFLGLVACLASRMALNCGQCSWPVSRSFSGDAVPRSMAPASQGVL